MAYSPFTSYVGDTGPKGEAGGNIVFYAYNHQTGTATDPLVRKFSFFENDLSDVSNIYVHRTGLGGVNHEAWISGLDDSTNSSKGALRLFNSSGSALQFALFNVTGDVAGYTGINTGSYYEYYSIPSEFVYSSYHPSHLSTGVFLDSDSVAISFTRAGDIGPVGAQGNIGPQGPVGASYGPQGPQGEIGPQGPSGATGITGPQGSQGIMGLAGPQGNIGPSGATGITGPQGVTGEIGPQGITGTLGPQGPSGATGILGPQGPQGPIGPQGSPAGPQGPAGIISGGGFLAYNNASQSLTATTDQKISLNLTDFNFENYFNTTNSLFTPSISGAYYLDAQVWTDTDGVGYNDLYSIPEISIKRLRGATTTILAQSKWGFRGDYTAEDKILTTSTVADLHSGDSVGVYVNPGAEGLLAENGLSKTYFAGHILGGPPGNIGPSGLVGASGTIGPQGPTGAQGAIGPQGPSGASGLAFVGSTGAQGPQGPQGTVGPQGLKGESGSAFVGSEGPQGPQGAQGEVGYVTGAGFYVYHTGQVNYSIAGAAETIIKEYSALGYDGADYTAGFDTQGDWDAVNLNSGIWKPTIPGKYLIKGSTKVNTYTNTGDYVILRLRMAHSGDDHTLTAQTLAEESRDNGVPHVTLDASTITNVNATGEAYFMTAYPEVAGTHTLEGASYDTFFTAHALGGVRGEKGEAGPVGSIGADGPQGLTGPQGAGGLVYNTVSSDTNMSINAGYIINHSTPQNKLVLTLPTGNSINGRMEVLGKSVGGWRVAQNTGQKIIFGYMETIEGTGGYIESSHNNDFVKLVCLNTGDYASEFAVAGSVGSIIVY